MALKRDKDAIKIQKDDAIKRNQSFFDFMLRMFNHLNQLYDKERVFLFIQYLNISQRNRVLSKMHQSLFQKEVVLRIRQTKPVEQIVTPTNQIRMQKRCM